MQNSTNTSSWTVPASSAPNPPTTPGTMARIDGKLYPTQHISSGSVTIQNIDRNYAAGDKILLVLEIPSGKAFLHISLEGDVLSYNRQSHVLDCRFINLTPDNTALFNRVLKTLSQDNIAAKEELSNITTKDGFIRVMKQSAPTSVATAQQPAIKKQLFGMGLASFLGLSALAFILYNIYMGLFTVKSFDAMVAGPVIGIRTTSDGVFTSSLTEETLTVEPGQALASITPLQADGKPGDTLTLTSPCDCVIATINTTNGEHVHAGDTLISLTPADAKPWIVAEVDAEKALKIRPATQVIVTISGSEIDYAGQVVSVRSGMNAPASFATTGMQRPAQVKISLNQKVPADFAGRPARVVFSVR